MKIVITLLLVTYAHLAFGQNVDEYQQEYNKGNAKAAILGLRQLERENPRDVEVKKNLVNYYSWEEYYDLSKKEARSGYLLSKKQESPYPYFFYDKKTRNRFFIEGSFTHARDYDATGIFLESSHNYSKNDWLYINYQQQTRQTNPSQRGSLIGIGGLTFLSKSVYLYSMFSFGPDKSFLPTYSLENELYYFKGNNTYSLNVKYSSYVDNNSVITVSPNYRHDFDGFYLGARPYVSFSNGDVFTSARIYGGYGFTYRLSGELGYAFGGTKEDGVNTVNFYSFDAMLKYKLTHSTDIGLKYNHYDAGSPLSGDTYFINLLWRY